MLSLASMIERMSAAPARVLGLPGGSLAVDGPADVCVFNPSAPWVVEPEKMRSLSKNTPFAGRELPGRAVLTICGGKVTHQAKE